uniref:Tetratricopeptide repeat protein 7 N-terminal domain-containing protein n=1 Tax=Denticeps clupeoides TaxID=299321 RepID=A0AAY4DB91_9TELE
MSSRISFSQYRLEAEVERCRSECQWEKVPGLVEQLAAARIHQDDDYGMLLLAEALLEECLLENIALLHCSTPLSEQSKLGRAKAYLNNLLSRGRLEPRCLNEALLLMAKVHYAQGRYRDAQGMCARVGIDDLTRDGQPLYYLRLLAEAFVIKGLSLDHQALSAASRVRLSEREEECLSCYLSACDAALLYLQELDKVCMPVRLKNIIGAHQLRRVMRVVESRGSQTFRKVMSVARKLAEVLLSSISEDGYWNPLSTPPNACLNREGTTHPKDVIYPSPKPPQRYSGDSSFCPQDVVEEAILLLLITESMASADAILSRTPEHSDAREASVQDTSSVYDLLTIGLARRGQYDMLSECLERAMKFSFNEFHIWYQLGLSLMASGKGVAAVSVLKECAKMSPQDPTPPLLATKICINQLHWLKEAEALAQSVIDMDERAEEALPRAHLAIGLCLSLRASDATLKADRDDLNRKALQTLQKAHTLDPQDPQIALYLSLQLALIRQVSAAMEPLEAALSLRSDELHSLHLLALLLSAQKHHQHALDTINLALSQHPENFNLLFTKVKLEETVFGPSQALQTCEEMLHLWQTDDTSSIPPAESGQLSQKQPSGPHLILPDFQETETGSQSAPSLAVSRLEQAMSEVSAISSAHRQGPTYIWTTLERIWLQAGELFMAQGRLKEAQFCVQEAGLLFPSSHSVLLLRGRLAELRGNLAEAKSLYDEALAINPRGHHILLHLGKLLVHMGRVALGEKFLRDALQAQSTAHEAWSGLGEALQNHGCSQAQNCFLTALELESSCPIRPFTVIPREL